MTAAGCLTRRHFMLSCAALRAAAHARDVSASGWRSLFPALRAADAGTIYLDSAATTHRTQGVLDAIVQYYQEDNANPARAHARARRAAERLADARKTIAA